jgi:subtilisin family serine protease
MLLKLILLSLVFAKSAVKVISNPSAQALSSNSGRPDRIIFKFNKELTSGNLLDKPWFRECLSGVKILEGLAVEVGSLGGGCDLDDIISQMNQDDDIETAERDETVTINAVPNDPDFSKLWGMTKIQAPMAWNTHTGGSNVVVSVIDTGIDYNHPDLKDNMWVNPGEIPGNGIDDDGNGYVDDVHGINAIDGSGNPMDDNMHGSHCAGTIAGKGNNGLGVSGVMQTAKLLGCKFLDASGSGSISDALECLNYSILYASVSNNSWGGGGFSNSFNTVLNNNPNHLFVAAAGNADGNHDNGAGYPCDYANAFCVASTKEDDGYSGFSDYGSSVDIAAPGSNIFSTVPGGGYQSLSGTSMATPHVAGLAGLLRSFKPNLSSAEIKAAIMNTGDALSTADKFTKSNKRINAAKAIASLADGPNPPVTSTTTKQSDSQPEPPVGDCLAAGTRVEIVPGSRYAAESSGCATLETACCKTTNRGGYTKTVFDNGYVNFFQFLDVQPCTIATTTTLPPTTTVADTVPDTTSCSGDHLTWNAGWGLCLTYAEGQSNHNWCDKDSKDGFLAEQVCPQCGKCTVGNNPEPTTPKPTTPEPTTPTPTTPKPTTTQPPVTTENGLPGCQGDSSSWNAGWGLCPTYAEGQSNHNWCDQDSKNGFLAEQVCSECGKCAAGASSVGRREYVFM